MSQAGKEARVGHSTLHHTGAVTIGQIVSASQRSGSVPHPTLEGFRAAYVHPSNPQGQLEYVSSFTYSNVSCSVFSTLLLYELLPCSIVFNAGRNGCAGCPTYGVLHARAPRHDTRGYRMIRQPTPTGNRGVRSREGCQTRGGRGGEVRGMGLAGYGCGSTSSTRSTSRSQMAPEVIERMIEERVEELNSQIRAQMREEFASMLADQTRKLFEHFKSHVTNPSQQDDDTWDSELMRFTPLPTDCGYSKDEAVPQTEFQQQYADAQETGDGEESQLKQLHRRGNKGKGKAS